MKILRSPLAGIRGARRRAGKAFLRDDRAVTSIEFAILGLPFFLVIGAILETAIVFLASQVLDSAVQDSGRLIRTGQAQFANYTATNFRAAICSELFNLFNCANLQIKVSTVTDFASATVVTPIDTTQATAPWTLVPSYCPGVGKSIIMVQAYYKWPVMLNFGGFNLQSSPDGTRLLGAVRVFENEPFGGTATTCP